MSEKIYILNENGSICGLKDRDEVHQTGILHAAVQCWIINETGEVLIQRRAATKDKSAGKWDVSFGGHCVLTEQNQDIWIQNVIKEGYEELGLTIDPEEVIKLGEVRYSSQGNKNRELLGIFLIKLKKDQAFSFTDREVSEVRWMSQDELYQNLINNPKGFANRLGAFSLLKFYEEK